MQNATTNTKNWWLIDLIACYNTVLQNLLSYIRRKTNIAARISIPIDSMMIWIITNCSDRCSCLTCNDINTSVIPSAKMIKNSTALNKRHRASPYRWSISLPICCSERASWYIVIIVIPMRNQYDNYMIVSVTVQDAVCSSFVYETNI